MTLDYAMIWAALIGVAVLAYILLDGFDLGVGILFGVIGGEAQQSQAMNSVAPVWDGNETWLILGGGGLLAVFPLAYSIMMPALYAPIIAMLLALVLRGVAFEYRWRTQRARFVWNWAFVGGSLVATFCQGIVLGALIQGVKVVDRAYAGGWWDWLTPFSVFTGICLVIGYALLGSTWLIMKTEGSLNRRARAIARITAPLLLLLIVVTSLWTIDLQPAFVARWFALPAAAYVLAVPVLVLACAVGLLTSLNRPHEARPFLYTQGLFVLCYLGLLISFYPNLIPPQVSIWDAAGPDTSLKFLLVGAVVLIPLILVYTAFAYWVFRGKVDTEAGYH